MVKLNEKQRFIALAVAVVLLFGGVFASVAMDIAQSRAINNLQTKLYDDDATANNIHAEEFVTEMASTSKVSLAAVTPMRMAVNPRSGAATAAVNYVTQTIKATVFPENASNVKVDWSIAWESSSQTANIASYIEVVPVTEGGLTANVNCYRALPGNAVITVTTRDGGHQATCTVKFVGIPSSMEVTHASLTQGTGGSYIVPMFQRQTYNFDIKNDPNVMYIYMYHMDTTTSETLGEKALTYFAVVRRDSSNSDWYEDGVYKGEATVAYLGGGGSNNKKTWMIDPTTWIAK